MHVSIILNTTYQRYVSMQLYRIIEYIMSLSIYKFDGW